MSDFQTALQQQLERNAELARERAEAEQEMDRAREAQLEAARLEAERQQQARNDRHAQLAEHLAEVSAQLKAASPETFIVRSGWSQSGEEYRAKISTRKTSPARTLLVDLDRDDDQVVARWNSEVGDSIELWRLLEVTPEMITQLLLQVADQSVWDRASAPPAFPTSAA